MDTGQYIGIPFQEHGRDFDGCDCWGLVRLVYQCELGIKLPDFSERYERCRKDENVPIIIGEETSRWDRVHDVAPFDVLLFLDAGRPGHVGLALDRRRMLHTTVGVDVCIEDFTSGLWRDKLAGTYRHSENKRSSVA